jgi:hypothetical protein
VKPYAEYDHWKVFWDPAQRYLGGQCAKVAVRFLDKDDLELATTELPVWSPCKVYVYVDGSPESDYGHVFVGLVDQRGGTLRVGFFLKASVLGLDPKDGTVYAAADAAVFGVGAGLAGGVAGAAAGWVGLTFLQALIVAAGGPVGALGAVGYGLFVLGGTALGALPGVGYTVGGGMGLGQLRDDGGYQYTHCRAWDISREEHHKAMDVMKRWKEKSDRRDLLYDVAGLHGSGNCRNFTAEVLASTGVVVAGLDVRAGRSPTLGETISDPHFERVLANEPQTEVNAKYPAMAPPHPWRFAPQGGRGTGVTIDTLGSYVPVPSLTDEQVEKMRASLAAHKRLLEEP